MESSTKGGIYEVNFGYNAKMGVYANSSSDIPELSEIFEGTLNVWPSFIQQFERMDFNNQILINITKSIKDALGPK